MTRLLLGPLLRHVDDVSATIWVETSGPCTVEILGNETRTFSVGGRHYALVIVEDLEPGSVNEYEVRIDHELAWPDPELGLPPSIIRTTSEDAPVRVVVGSCRAAAPHVPPYTEERALDHEGRGVDTLWAKARLLMGVEPTELPDLLLFAGDQIYADDSSPCAQERIERLRDPSDDLPSEIVADFEEYCWLYHEAWSPPMERWLLSTVSSAMIFDDHDMIDDWNISAEWVADIRSEPWWTEHAVGGLMSYWIYQHLGNLSPATVRHEGLLAALCDVPDGTELLRQWAMDSEAQTPLPGGYQFSFSRHIGDVTVVVIDCRNGRVLEGETRRMIGEDEWAWVRAEAEAAREHLLLVTSMPVFVADGIHDLQVWSERVCGGAWGRRAARWGERLRRSLDLEDWSAFETSYLEFVDLIIDLQAGATSPRSISVVSGDIHFSYAARLNLGPDAERSHTWQVVSSPMRNALIPPERGVMRFSLTRTGRALAAMLRRGVRAADTRPRMDVVAGPLFANNICELGFDGASAQLRIEQFTTDADSDPERSDVVEVDLT